MPRKSKKFHFVYKTTNLLNNKFYVGMHSTNNLEDNYLGSGKRLWYSVKKYGRNNHRIEILEFFPDRVSLKNREKEIVNEKFLKNPMCMNLVRGGEGGLTSAEHAFRFHSAGGKSVNGKNLEKYYEKGREGKNNPFFGKHHSGDFRKKIGELTSESQKGSKNSQYGKIWIYSENLRLSKLVSREEAVNFLSTGWTVGRKIFQ